MTDKSLIIKIFPERIRTLLKKAELDFELLQEIRLRAGQPLAVRYENREWFLGADGRRTKCREKAVEATQEEVSGTLELAARYSLYAFQEELRQGFLTLPGGHRMGLAGQTVLEDGRVRTMKYIAFLNIRLAHEITGCADRVLPFVYGDDGQVRHTLIISPPRCGKTTLLRDMVRQISDGNRLGEGMTVGVVDERSEIGGCFMGIPGNDLGIRTDILDGCPKAEGMMMLIRSMSPQVLAVDEIGRREDVEALETALRCGCRLLATIHGNSLEDVRRKPILEKIWNDRLFERYILLDNRLQTGRVLQILNEKGDPLC